MNIVPHTWLALEEDVKVEVPLVVGLVARAPTDGLLPHQLDLTGAEPEEAGHGEPAAHVAGHAGGGGRRVATRPLTLAVGGLRDDDQVILGAHQVHVLIVVSLHAHLQLSQQGPAWWGQKQSGVNKSQGLTTVRG